MKEDIALRILLWVSIVCFAGCLAGAFFHAASASYGLIAVDVIFAVLSSWAIQIIYRKLFL